MEAEVRESDTKDGRPDTSEEANRNKDNKAEMVREPESSNQNDCADGGSNCNSTNQKEEMTTIESKSTNPAKETLANGDCSDISENNKSVELNSKKDSQKETNEQDSSPSSRGVNSNINSNADDTARQGGKSPKKSVRIADEPVQLFHIPRFLEMDRKLPQKAEQQLRSFIHSKDSKHLKQWLRSHHWPVDHPIRSNLWLLTCKFVFKSQSNIYHEMLEDLFREDMPELLPLPPFVDTDYVPQYCLTEAGVQTVHTILVILDQLNPDVTYCPTLFPLAALFMHFMEPEDCFNCLYSMIRTTESRYLAQTNVAVDATYLVMRDLARHHAKSAYSSIVKDTDGNVEPVFKNWTWWIFIYLPFPILVQVMDCYLFEGMKVLYRVALAILILFQKHTAKLHEPHSPLLGANVSARIKHFCEDMPYPIEKILKTAFGIRGLGRKELRKLQVRYEMYEKSQTVRMTRASSFARSVSRSSFSAPTPSRSMSIPAPISAKRAHAKGETVNQELLMTIWSWIPARYTICQPQLLFTTELHGISLATLYRRLGEHEPTLFVIKTAKNEVFGAFCSTSWRERYQKGENRHLSYFGTGETFIFTLNPRRRAYYWVGLSTPDYPPTASMFLAGDQKTLMIGGGSGTAIHLDAGLVHCRTEKCDTFENEPLSSTPEFSCKVLEVFGFK